MKNIVRITLMISFVVCLQACASYRIRVNGFSGTDISLLNPGASIFVVENPKAENPIFEREINGKIVKLLKNRGYQISSPENADYYLYYTYGIGSGRTVTSSHQQGGKTVTVVDPVTGFGESVRIPGKTVVYSDREYDRWLFLKLIGGQQLRNTNESKTVWVGEIESSGKNRDLREVIDYLLIAGFEYFGQDTGKAVKTTMSPNDKRAKELRE